MSTIAQRKTICSQFFINPTSVAVCVCLYGLCEGSHLVDMVLQSIANLSVLTVEMENVFICTLHCSIFISQYLLNKRWALTLSSMSSFYLCGISTSCAAIIAESELLGSIAASSHVNPLFARNLACFFCSTIDAASTKTLSPPRPSSLMANDMIWHPATCPTKGNLFTYRGKDVISLDPSPNSQNKTIHLQKWECHGGGRPLCTAQRWGCLIAEASTSCL